MKSLVNKRRKRIKKWIAWTVPLLLIFGTGYYWYATSITVMAEMQAISGEFRPGDSWSLASESTIPPLPFCSETSPCPHHSKLWRFEDPSDKLELTKKIRAAGWSTAMKSSCEPSPSNEGYHATCSTRFEKDGYSIWLIYFADTYDSTKNAFKISITRV